MTPAVQSVLRNLVLLILLCGAGAAPALQAKPEAASSGEKTVKTKDTKVSTDSESDYFAQKRMEALESLIEQNRGKSDSEKLQSVNDFFNRVRYASDEQTWGVKDYWARPSEFLRRDQGDCEDFVIAKYFTLRQLGVAEDKLYFTYVKSLKFNQAHMVLTYYETPRAVPLVLDNLNYRILPSTQRKDLVYVYSFNAASLFLNTQKGRGRTIEGGSTRNKKWAAFLKRIEKDGL